MRSDPFDGLVSLIYDAALEETRWAQVVVDLAKLVDCGQAAFEWHDHSAGVTVHQAPLTDPTFARSYVEHYGREFSLLRRTGAFPVGRVFRGTDFIDYEWMRRSAYYNEWWKPQGVGGGSLFANVALGNHAAILVSVYKHLGHEFSKVEEQAFGAAARHMVRAVGINAKLRLAALCQPAAAAGMPPGLIIVEANARILSGDEAALGRLRAAGLIDRLTPNLIATPDRAIERFVRQAAKGGNGNDRSGRCVYRGPDGEPIEITVFPCSENGQAAAWLTIDKPAALLQIAAPGDRKRARADRLAREHGLTPAEAAVALEVARGDGRAAAAQRLGIRETTVRSHLTAIFEKLDIHRQAELARFIVDA